MEKEKKVKKNKNKFKINKLILHVSINLFFLFFYI